MFTRRQGTLRSASRRTNTLGYVIDDDDVIDNASGTTRSRSRRSRRQIVTSDDDDDDDDEYVQSDNNDDESVELDTAPSASSGSMHTSQFTHPADDSVTQDDPMISTHDDHELHPSSRKRLRSQDRASKIDLEGGPSSPLTKKPRILFVKSIYLDHTQNKFLLDKDVGHFEKGVWHDDMKEEELAGILDELSTAAGLRAQGRAQAYAKAHCDSWNLPETAGKEDHRDRLRRFSDGVRGLIKSKDPLQIGLISYTEDDHKEMEAFLRDFERSFYLSEEYAPRSDRLDKGKGRVTDTVEELSEKEKIESGPTTPLDLALDNVMDLDDAIDAPQATGSVRSSFESLKLSEHMTSRPFPISRPPLLLKALPDNLADEVKSILQDLKFQVKHSSISLTAQDIRLLGPKRWLSGTIINAYGMLVMENSSADICILDSYLYTSILNGKKMGIEIGQYSLTATFTSKIHDLMAKQVILFPIHIESHWLVMHINLPNQTMVIYDSLQSHTQECYPETYSNVGKWFKVLCKDHQVPVVSLSRKLPDYKVPQQTNTFDCGVFAAQFIEALARGESNFRFSKDNMPFIRTRMIWELVNNKILTELDQVASMAEPASGIEDVDGTKPGKIEGRLCERHSGHGSVEDMIASILPTPRKRGKTITVDFQCEPEEDTDTTNGHQVHLLQTMMADGIAKGLSKEEHHQMDVDPTANASKSDHSPAKPTISESGIEQGKQSSGDVNATSTQNAPQTTRGYDHRGWLKSKAKLSSLSGNKKTRSQKKSVKGVNPSTSETPKRLLKTSPLPEQSLPDVPLVSTSSEPEDEWIDDQCMEGLQWCMDKYTSWKNLAVKLLQLTKTDIHSGSRPPQEFFDLMLGLLQDIIFVWDPPKASERNMIRAWKWAELQDRVFVGAIRGLIHLIGLFEAHQTIVHPHTERWESSRQWLNYAILARNVEA